MPSARESGKEEEESPECWNNGEKRKEEQEKEQEQEGEREQTEARGVQGKEEEESQAVVQPDSLDNTACMHSHAIIGPNSNKGLLRHGYCRKKQNAQSRQRELLFSLQPLDCSAHLFESVQRFLSPKPGS